jgi:hypothetical protein
MDGEAIVDSTFDFPYFMCAPFPGGNDNGFVPPNKCIDCFS